LCFLGSVPKELGKTRDKMESMEKRINYYGERLRTNQEIDRQILDLLKNPGKKIDLNMFFLNLTATYAISEKAIEKRIDRHLKGIPRLRRIVEEGTEYLTAEVEK